MQVDNYWESARLFLYVNTIHSKNTFYRSFINIFATFPKPLKAQPKPYEPGRN